MLYRPLILALPLTRFPAYSDIPSSFRNFGLQVTRLFLRLINYPLRTLLRIRCNLLPIRTYPLRF